MGAKSLHGVNGCSMISEVRMKTAGLSYSKTVFIVQLLSVLRGWEVVVKIGGKELCLFCVFDVAGSTRLSAVGLRCALCRQAFAFARHRQRPAGVSVHLLLFIRSANT